MNEQQFITTNIELMNKLQGYDVIIVCTSTPEQANYWQARLMATRGSISPPHAKIVAVHEDWNGGAGNGLGTLYAYEKAIAKASYVYSIDIAEMLREESISVALYHTAGKGTRLAPLPGSENNNKSGVKLPAMLSIGGRKVPMTILESVIKQTGVYANSRRGRLSVFWGDQIFIPSCEVEYVATHHIDILAALAPMPTQEEWASKGLEKYGIIAVNNDDDAAQLDKVSFATATRLLEAFGQLKSVGTSLGSFSVDHEMLQALLDEFASELTEKCGKLDTDPHFWMPFTLQLDAYVEIMAQKGMDSAESQRHHKRMQNMLIKFQETATPKPLFGCINVGSAAHWWDYGQLRLYLKNNMLLTHSSFEAESLRKFLGIRSRIQACDIGKLVGIDSMSCVQSAQLLHGIVSRSVVSNVFCDDINVSDCVLVNVTARSIHAKNCVIYNIACEIEEGLELDEGTVLAGVYLPNGEHIIVRSKMNICGGDAWKKIVEENGYSFEQIYDMNSQADVATMEEVCYQDHSRVIRLIENSRQYSLPLSNDFHSESNNNPQEIIA